MRSFVVTAGLLWLLSPLAAAGQIYKWVDAQGVTHFDAQPPAGQNVTTVDSARPVPSTPPSAPTTPASPVNGAAQQRTIDTKVKKQVAEQEARLQKLCVTARTNLAQLKNNPRIRQEVDGEYKRLTEEERQAKIAETQAVIDDQCS